MAIAVVVYGAGGRMGSEVLNALCRDPELEAVAAVDSRAQDSSLSLPDGSGQIPYSRQLEPVLSQCRPDVMVDFTVRDSTLAAVPVAAQCGVNLVIGTSGLSHEDITEIERLCTSGDVGAIIAPNFSLGAVLMIHLAQLAARYFDNAEILEKHHDKKVDAPSGTALATARAMLEARGRPFSYPVVQEESLANTRGGQIGGVGIHSVRLPGLLAHQEVVFGAPGQTLSIRHDTMSRESFMPGVVMAIKQVVKLKGVLHGLEKTLGL